MIAADVFEAGERVDVTGISKGKGFTGVMKRHNFKGQGASHGNHKKHRAPGAIGACATPARVFKGMRMAGQHGTGRVTTLNLEVVEGDAERDLLLVKGAVPGPTGGLVFVRNAVKSNGGAGERRADGREGRRHDRAGRQKRAASTSPDAMFGDQPNRSGDAPGRHRAARRGAVRHAQHQDARRGPGRRRQAVAPEGHGPRPAGLDPVAAVAGRRRRPRAEPRDYAQRTPKKMIRLALRSALSDRAADGRVMVVDEWGIDEPRPSAPSSPRGARAPQAR